MISFALVSCSEQKPGESNKLIEKEASRQPDNSKEKINPAIYQLMMNELMSTLKNWNDILPAYKLKAVQTTIELFKIREKAILRKPAEFYVDGVSQLLKQTPGFSQGLPTAIKILAVMEYDFDNGEDKDVLAKNVLGQEVYANLQNTKKPAEGGIPENNPIVQ
ncbi:MAG: hypothetical protein A3G33_09690 [Omnitrophica bacterium RIFCSPLOWO2_12_FULL_44_17]|uniref:Uncharacterized protein n=1 Tax=Candidatus Danuiimicrobium aquiferis TaxID=1801832 RepID=A0A1G1KX39_9BACT|nr:MAG: hypothetical protein A3B72_09670 [Omnitrophica bacterium RIFCSPHIGHO2_02_FULL_45_28]OGW89823.1 MAG: hypothetical protein A3E74_02625 [Omnitrophica bacterium RIFCSPHIGHO2_12_FULL_44_12]OGW97451.1 MAG: hypothetical protein A3G33_09690 [Omnitrophica bacterium RIFCSPLOWO2_12_FULL_44_17]OGX04524.1 MAG: hypothetical protein A3J12_10730 [Omnitrophica bacterium RIFCSPLOWO2_02_FULL_44_11]